MPSSQAESVPAQETDASVVNLSSHHLKRIDRLPKGLSPSTLLLSNNEISKVENLQYFAYLQQLSLAGNHIVDMRGISAAQGLRVLDLSNNSIVGIEGLSSLRNLEWLNLSGNSIEEIENIDRNTNLNHLDLSDNSIAVISGLRSLKKLKTLLLHGNLISSLGVIKEQLPSTVCTLSLADNDISDLNEMIHLSYLVNLQQLSLVNNPCILPSSSWRLEINYRPYLVYCCPNLKNLDGHLVTNEDRILAKILNQAFHQIGQPSPGQHVHLVSILHHICNEPTATTKTFPEEDGDGLDGNILLESESFYIPVPPSDEEETLQTQSDDPIMTEEEALRLLSLAATIIQAHVRGYFVRKKFDFCQYRRRKYAAAFIQAAWKGYCARTRDIKVVNIRNELQVRRLISIINHLHSKLEREHEEAVKSREQLKMAIKFLWSQITEQRRDNHLYLHKKKVKAAITIQAWWRGYMSRKAFPRVLKKMDSDKVSTLFTLCHKLQIQLDEVTLQIKEITKGDKQNRETLPEGQMVSDGQGPVIDTAGQLDSLAETIIVSLTDNLVNPLGTYTGHELVRKEDKFAAPVSQPLGDAREKADKIGEAVDKSENSIPVSGQMEFQNDASEPGVNTTDPSIPDQMNQDMYNVALTNTHPTDIGITKPTSSDPSLDFQDDNTVAGTLSHLENTDGYESDEKVSPGPVGVEMSKMDISDSNLEHLQDGNSALSSTHQEDLGLKNGASAADVQMDQLEGEGLSSSVEKTLDSQPTEGTQKQEVDAEEWLLVDIPEIIVSSPVPTDDESSNEGSAVEGDVDEVQMEVKQPSLEKQDIAESQSEADASMRSYKQDVKDIESGNSAADTGADQTKNEQESSVSENHDEKSQLALGTAANFVAFTEASSGEHSAEVIAEHSSRSTTQGSVPNLGERASSLLSQLRSEIASMKSARLSGVLPNIASEDDANTEEKQSKNANAATAISTSQECDNSQAAPQERDNSQAVPRERDTIQVSLQDRDTTQDSDTFQLTSQTRDTYEVPPQERDIFQTTPQERDTSEPASQQRDTSQPGPASRVTYGLPLFEDFDSTCTSFTLDDFISDPATEDASNLPSDTGYRYDEHEGAI